MPVDGILCYANYATALLLLYILLLFCKMILTTVNLCDTYTLCTHLPYEVRANIWKRKVAWLHDSLRFKYLVMPYSRHTLMLDLFGCYATLISSLSHQSLDCILRSKYGSNSGLLSEQNGRLGFRCNFAVLERKSRRWWNQLPRRKLQSYFTQLWLVEQMC